MRIQSVLLALVSGWLAWQANILPAHAQNAAPVPDKARKFYEQAEIHVNNRKFEEAVDALEKAIDKAPDYADAYFRLGNLHERMLEIEKATQYYAKCVELRPEYRPFIVAYGVLGDFALESGKYAEARTYFEKYLALKPAKTAQIKETERKIASCTFALDAVQKPLPFKPVPLNPTVNKFALQYFPGLTADQQTMIFTAKGTLRYEDSDENLYVSSKANNEWTEPKPLEKINTVGNEGTCSISADGRTLVFTACQGRNGFGSCDLFIAYKNGDEWSEPMNLGNKVNSPYWESQPSLSADGRTLYFASNRPGSLGKDDIWVSELQPDNTWSKPENLGPAVNTPDFESSPFIHVNGKTLYFATKGRVGMGGADLYVSELDAEGNWSEGRNLGYPINTYEDQISLFVTADGKKGYYAVQEKKGRMYLNSTLHEFDMPAEIAVKNKSNYLKGVVYDAKTKKALNARVELFNLGSGKLETVMNSDRKTGDYLTVLTEGASYALYVSRDGYLFKSLYFDYSDKKADEPLLMDVFLEPLEAGSKGVLNNLFFATGEYSLEDKSKTELNKLIQLLNGNQTLRLEISGHTDDVGNDADNQVLSEKRAKSVYDYLVQAGVPAKRLKFVGCGEAQAAVPNTTDENRQQNRRIEFKVL